MSGSLLFLPESEPAPAGYTRLGSYKQELKNKKSKKSNKSGKSNKSKNLNITIIVYQRD
mgnify:FL=1|jgi:hypothetical protein